MKTIFDVVGAILHTKDKSIFKTSEDEAIFQPFMVNRWISMYSGEMANLVNMTTNKYSQLFPKKQDLFNFYVSIYPNLRRKKINYVKKTKATPKKEKDDEPDMMAIYARNNEVSIREAKEMQSLVDYLTTTSNI